MALKDARASSWKFAEPAGFVETLQAARFFFDTTGYFLTRNTWSSARWSEGTASCSSEHDLEERRTVVRLGFIEAQIDENVALPATTRVSEIRWSRL